MRYKDAAAAQLLPRRSGCSEGRIIRAECETVSAVVTDCKKCFHHLFFFREIESGHLDSVSYLRRCFGPDPGSLISSSKCFCPGRHSFLFSRKNKNKKNTEGNKKTKNTKHAIDPLRRQRRHWVFWRHMAVQHDWLSGRGANPSGDVKGTV